nr:DUF4283 domain-containing protein [Tanacetum cinerariifolium]
MSIIRKNEKKQIKTPSKFVDSDYGTMNAKNKRNKKKKNFNNDVMCNDGLESKQDKNLEKMDECQREVNIETVEEVKDVNGINKESDDVEKTGIVNENDETMNINGINTEKDEKRRMKKEGNKASYAKMASSSLDNKLNLIPTEINDDGIEVVIFDEEIVNEGSKKWELIVCGYFVGYKMSYQELSYNLFRMWGKYGLKSIIPNALSTKGISVVASRLGTPLIMDQITTNMCKLGNGRVGFARVLIDVEVEKDYQIKLR